MTELNKEIAFVKAVANAYYIPLTDEEVLKAAKHQIKLKQNKEYQAEIRRARAWNEAYNRQQSLKQQTQDE